MQWAQVPQKLLVIWAWQTRHMAVLHCRAGSFVLDYLLPPVFIYFQLHSASPSNSPKCLTNLGVDISTACLSEYWIVIGWR